VGDGAQEAIQLRRDNRSLVLASRCRAVAAAVRLCISFGCAQHPHRGARRGQLGQSRALLEVLRSSGYFQYERSWSGPARSSVLDGTRVQLVLVIPPDFIQRQSQRRAAGRGGRRGRRLDANTATIILAYTRADRDRYALDAQLGGAACAAGAARKPGLVQRGAGVAEHDRAGAGGGDHDDGRAMLTSLTNSRAEWERGTMEQLPRPPVARAEVVSASSCRTGPSG